MLELRKSRSKVLESRHAGSIGHCSRGGAWGELKVGLVGFRAEEVIDEGIKNSLILFDIDSATQGVLTEDQPDCGPRQAFGVDVASSFGFSVHPGTDSLQCGSEVGIVEVVGLRCCQWGISQALNHDCLEPAEEEENASLLTWPLLQIVSWNAVQ